ncbi:MAG: hypothetical protein JNK04_07180, partial [Myxococcales bacterium]|nr:hypothetical protein [Myxococcales bacterium]
MFARLLLIASVCCACSLQGLADGGGGDGAGGAPTTTTTTVGGASGDGGSSVTTGGAGGAPDVSRFVWLESIGNGESQATSPFSTDPHGSSLRMSEPDAAGAVWLAVVTSGELDPDGPGGFEAMGMAGTRGLFLIEVQSDGAISAFHGYPGPPTSIENGLSVDGVARVGIGVAVVGTFRTGSIDFGIGVITQNNANADDGYLLVADASGQAVAARQITGTSGDTQTARAVAALGSTVLAAGKLKRSWAVKDAATGVADPSCAFDDAAEVFERAYVASFDADTLS